MKDFYIVVSATNETYIILAESANAALQRANERSRELYGDDMQQPEAILLKDYIEDDILDVSNMEV